MINYIYLFISFENLVPTLFRKLVTKKKKYHKKKMPEMGHIIRAIYMD